MFFRKRKRIRHDHDQELLSLIERAKHDWLNHKRLIQKSIEPSEELLYQFRISEAKYFFAIREAKIRNVSIGKFK